MRFTLSHITLLLALVAASAAHAGNQEASETEASTTPPIEAAPPETEVSAPASPAPADGEAEAAEEADEN